MFKAMIIDDEDFIREGLKKIIDWEKCGFTVCGEAADGAEGLEKIREMQPELVIVDVCMPKMDGLMMMQLVSKQGIKTKFIILSGYSEFDYAQKALNYGSKAYILKPVDEEELQEKVRVIYDEIIEEDRKKTYNEISASSVSNKIMEILLTGKPDYEKIQEYSNLYGFNLPWDYYRMVVININQFLIADRFRIERKIQRFLGHNASGLFFSLWNYSGVMLRKKEIDGTLHEQLFSLYKDLKRGTDKNIVISVGEAVNSMEDIFQSFKFVKVTADNSFLYDSMPYVLCSNSMNYLSEPVRLNEIAEELFGAVYINDTVRINTILEALYNCFVGLKYTEERIKIEYVKLYISLEERLKKECTLYIAKNSEDITLHMNEQHSLRRLHGFMKFKLMEVAESVSELQPDSLMNKIVDYIQRNYYDTQLSLKNLSAIFGYNPTYMGVMIKNHTGVSFNRFLENVRVEYAKKFLAEGIKVNKVVDMVGFSDPDYFYKRFKKNTGLSPSQFKA